MQNEPAVNRTGTRPNNRQRPATQYAIRNTRYELKPQISLIAQKKYAGNCDIQHTIYEIRDISHELTRI